MQEDGHLLSLLAQLKQDDGSWLPTEQLTNTVLQLFYYGHSNTANHLIWLIAHMFQRGHAQDLCERRPSLSILGAVTHLTDCHSCAAFPSSLSEQASREA